MLYSLILLSCVLLMSGSLQQNIIDTGHQQVEKVTDNMGACRCTTFWTLIV